MNIKSIVRRNVEFHSCGIVCRGWLYTPSENAIKCPTIVMAHGMSGTKEIYLDKYAELFSQNGFAVLVFDYRYLGESDGEPRNRMYPEDQVEDYRNAISYVSTLKEVDSKRLGIWGSSFGGGHCLRVAAIDKRVKCVVAQVPFVYGWATATRALRPDILKETIQNLIKYREARYQGAPVQYLPITAPKGEPCLIPTQAAYEFFTESGKLSKTWRNQITLESVEKNFEYEPGSTIDRISPIPLRMIVAETDEDTPTDLTLNAFERALEPKSLVLIPGGHFDAYTKFFEESSKPALEWFHQHLMKKE
jgi:fermentation-respiration switch protein FrsA (DUF1100 family)